MDPILAVACWIILWWLSFFVMLPIGVRNLAEEGESQQGHEPGAPARPNLGRKALWATGLATVLWIALMIALNVFYYSR
jgi:predicted secreted protein